MSKIMECKELLAHCKESITDLHDMLVDFSNSADQKIKKRAMLIAYWLKTYTYYIKKEDTFSTQSVFRLKRGSIVQVEFGYRIGRELGGRHYAVVIDADNSIYRNTVSVIPLGSLKDDYRDDKYSALLDDGIYGPVSKKLSALIGEAQKSAEAALSMDEEIKRAKVEDRPVLKAVQRQRVSTAAYQISQAESWLSEIEHMKQGSVAKIDQITTISKMRISNPLQKTHPLYGVRLTDRDMDKIDEKLRTLYFASGR